MSTDLHSHLFDMQEQLCYVKCGYCSTLLLVSVPCRSLASPVVTVRCGHCTCFLSVNMVKASFLPLHLFASMNQNKDELKKEVINIPEEESAKDQEILEKHSPPLLIPSDDDDDDDDDNEEEEEEEEINAPPVYQVINKPPEKKQRAPSAYNCFMREEIQRLKTVYPNMTHKQAFSKAAKNWAHFPPCQRGKEEKQGEKDAT